ncbi:MAG: PAS domain-containing protein [Vicinamibacteria bacterium]|nr:PAS domain-containing protein [Vicinamibacteria bacterium]
MDDHRVTENVLAAFETALAQPNGPTTELVELTLDYLSNYLDRCHNMKEEDHLFPLIEGHGIPRQGGPLGVMLIEHEQSRNLLARLVPLMQAFAHGQHHVQAELAAVFTEYAALLKGHFWKENDILYPLAERVLSADDGRQIVTGIAATEAKLGHETRARYYQLAERIATLGNLRDLSHGLDRDVLAAILNTLPVELSFVDATDTVRYFSHEKSDKIFARTRGAIGTQVQNCHPQRSLDAVNQILADFKAGRSRVAEFWIDFQAKKVHIRYFAVHDPEGRYLGCLEVVQDVTAIQKIAGEKRLTSPA